MSAEAALLAALQAALAGVGGLNRVEPGASVRATPPFAEIGPMVTGEWGTKDRDGREIRVTLVVRDLAERVDRLHALAGDCQAAVEQLPRALPDGAGAWRIASLAFQRSRIASDKAGQWLAAIEYRVRLLADA